MDFLTPYASKIESGLQQLNFPEKPEALYEPQRYILASNGKRIRPVLTLMGCGLCGKPAEIAMPAALSVELIHNFSLIHDDIMDQAKSRRGQPSVHIKWNTPTAILAGDGMMAQAILQLHNLPPSVDYKAINHLLLDGINKVCEGQALDIEYETRTDVTTAEYLEMISGKTAALIKTSLKMGGMAAGASPEKLSQLEIIGHSLGIAFQIQDDLFDVIADPEKFGKKRSGDIYEGKKTFLMVKTLESCSAAERGWLHNQLRHKPLQKEDVLKVIQLFEKYDIIDFSEKTVQEYYLKAEKALNQFDDSIYKADLSKLITYLKNRDF